MSGSNFIVPPKRWDAIEQRAEQWRAALSLADEPYFPVMEVLEKVLCNHLNMVRLDVIEMREMGDAEGFTDPQGEFIALREDVYLDAWNGDARQRFTASHEFGHFDLHTRIPLARAPSVHDIKPFRLSEPQANHFATCLLMPARFFSPGDSVGEVVRRHGVSFDAARYRLSYLRSKGRLAA